MCDQALVFPVHFVAITCCTHAINISLYGMLYDYIYAALQVIINVIIVIGIEPNCVRLTHVTLVKAGVELSVTLVV